MKAIFFDRDGVLVEHYMSGEHKYTVHPEHIVLKPGIESLKKLENDFYFFIITNAGGVGRKLFTPEEFWGGQKFFETECRQKFGVTFEKCYAAFWNPKAPKNFVELQKFRKPSPEMIFQIVREFPEIELKKSWVLGDSNFDMKLAENVGCQKIFIRDQNNEAHYANTGGIVPNFFAENLTEAIDFLLENG